ncbi:CBO0543 family protein [Neobacillus sp. NRS-1170]|uniref:CBO0543 family protein n=1 Tax=Neobacillus sp. NRS-1170 TaxID=3233898 RepID=UPI003D2CA5B7
MSWFVIFGTMLIIYPIAFFMKKRLSITEIYPTVVFGMFVSTLVDAFASYHKAWGFFEVDKVELSALWIIIGLYPIFAAMIINCYPYRGARWEKTIYLIVWSAFSTSYEWLSIKVGILWHIKWNLFYSFLLYPFIYFLLIIHVKFYRRLNKQIR